MLGKEVFIDTKLYSIGTYPGQSCLHRFLHHLTYLSGHGEATLALHGVGLDEENVAARGRPGQTDNHTGPLRALGYFAFAAHLNPT